MSTIHPVLVHFPIALLTISLIADALGFALRREEFVRVGWWTLVGGMIGLAGAIVSGLLAQSSISIPPVAKTSFETHEQMAFVVATAFVGLLFWRVAARTNLPSGRELLYLFISFLGVAALFLGAWHGGELVYRFGIGVTTP